MTVLLRAGSCRVLLGLLTAGALLGVLGQLLGGGIALRCLQLGCLLAGAAAAYALDEPAAEVVDACAVSSIRRTAARIGVLAAGLALVLMAWAVQGIAGLVVVQLLGTALLVLGPAAVLRRRVAEPGERIAPVALVALSTLLFFEPVSRRLPLYPPGPVAGSTYWLWAAAALVAGLTVGAAQRR